MLDDHSQAATKAIAQSIAADNAFQIEIGRIPLEEVIVEPDPREYVPPAYLHKTVPELAPAFGKLLDSLRDLNARFVGERTIEVEARLSLTGEHEWLEEAFFAWSQRYFETRGSLKRLNPQNANDPWQLYYDCVAEFDRLLGKRIVQPGTINMTVLNLSRWYILSAFAARVLEPDLRNYDASGQDRYGSKTNRYLAYRQVDQWNMAVTDFTTFLSQTAQHIPRKYAMNDSPERLAETKAMVASLAEDLNFLRSIPTVLHVNIEEMHQLTSDLWARLRWDVYHGCSIAAVLTSFSSEPLSDNTTKHSLAFRRDGWLCLREFSWLRVDPDYLPEERRAELAVNWYILDTLTAPLYEAWDRLDTDQVVSRGLEPDATEEEQDAVIAVACEQRDDAKPDTNDAETPAIRTKKPRIRVLWLSQFEKITTNQFRCEWSQAKGSERKVFRPGGKQHTFGCHTTDRKLQPREISDCLKKLGISLADFIEACTA